MRVRVLLFGVLKDHFGGSSREVVEIEEGARVADVLELFLQRAKGRDDLMRSLAVAVNREYTRADQVLQDGDEMALLPPVSGGAR